MRATSAGPILKILCIGTGRDGTLSLNRMIDELFQAEAAGRTAMHEYESEAFWNAFADFAETGASRFKARARDMIAECPHDCIVGNGYAPWLPLFYEVCGPDLKVVHLRRVSKNACVNSLVQNAELFPQAHGNYAHDKVGQLRRMAAFHFGEMSRDEWSALTIDQKFGWYFDKTHHLIDASSSLFKEVAQLTTEILNEPFSLHRIAEICGLRDVSATPKHLNTQHFASVVPVEHRSKIQWLFGQLDLTQAAAQDVYPLEYFLNAYIAWTGYQIRHSEQITANDYRSFSEIAASLKRAAATLEHTQRLVKLLDNELTERSTEEACAEAPAMSASGARR